MATKSPAENIYAHLEQIQKFDKFFGKTEFHSVQQKYTLGFFFL